MKPTRPCCADEDCPLCGGSGYQPARRIKPTRKDWAYKR